MLMQQIEDLSVLLFMFPDLRIVSADVSVLGRNLYLNSFLFQQHYLSR
jgi:hypothetical protein